MLYSIISKDKICIVRIEYLCIRVGKMFVIIQLIINIGMYVINFERENTEKNSTSNNKFTADSGLPTFCKPIRSDA